MKKKRRLDWAAKVAAEIMTTHAYESDEYAHSCIHDEVLMANAIAAALRAAAKRKAVGAAQ